MSHLDCKCPSHPRSQLKFYATTTNQYTYKPLTLPKQYPLTLPPRKETHYDKDILQTHYTQQYQSKPLPVQDSLSSLTANKSFAANTHAKKSAPFVAETEYNKTFKSHPITPGINSLAQNYVYKPKQSKFYGESSYKSEFKTHQHAIGQSVVVPTAPTDNGRSKVKAPFYGNSSYSYAFKAHKMYPRAPVTYYYRPQQKYFYGESSYKNTYKPLPRYAYPPPTEYCPVHPGKIVK